MENRHNYEPNVTDEDQVRVPLSARPRIAGRLSANARTFGGWGPRIG